MNIICGINPVLEALASGTRHFDRLLVAKGLRNRRVAEATRLAGQMGIPLRFETRETLDRMAGEVPHQGLVAVVSAKPVMTLPALLETTRAPELLLVLDGVEDPRNLGAILRTAEGAGVSGVVLPERHSAGLSETVARASAGGLEHVKVARVGNLAQALEELKARGLWVVGYDASGTERWDAVDYRRPIVLVFGGEDRGIRRLVREKCDHLASLPMFGHVGSLNVSVAAGIALYEVIRQRGSVPSGLRPIPPAAAAHRPHAEPASWHRPQEGGPEPEDETQDLEEDKAPLVLIEEHDAVTWSRPAVLRNVGGEGGRHERRPEQGRPGREGRRGKRRHRRGRRGPGGPPEAAQPRHSGRGPGGGGAPAGEGGRPGRPDTQGGPRTEAGGRPPEATEGPRGAGRPGRRRRRRRRRPAPPA